MGDEPVQVTRVAANAASKINASRRLINNPPGLGLVEGPDDSYTTSEGNLVFFNPRGNDLAIVGSALSGDVDNMVRELDSIANALSPASGGKKRRRKTRRGRKSRTRRTRK